MKTATSTVSAHSLDLAFETLPFSTLVEFDDGTSVDFFRRERPQLFFSADGEMMPLVLKTGVQEKSREGSYGVMVHIGADGMYRD